MNSNPLTISEVDDFVKQIGEVVSQVERVTELAAARVKDDKSQPFVWFNVKRDGHPGLRRNDPVSPDVHIANSLDICASVAAAVCVSDQEFMRRYDALRGHENV